MRSLSSDTPSMPMPTAADPSASEETLSLRLYLVILAGAVIWCVLILLAPISASAGWRGTADFLYAFFHRICHQLEGRSLHYAGEPLAVCARCTGIYAGFLAGVAVFPLLRGRLTRRWSPRLVLAAVLGPMILDVALGLTGLHEPGVFSRVATGAVAGVGLAYIILPAAFGAVRQLAARRQPTPTSTMEGLSDA